jgi:signal transduction histidine kinase
MVTRPSSIEFWPTIACATGIGVLISTEFLCQTYVWNHWPWDEVLFGWLGYATERVVVALAIAATVVLAGRLAGGGLASRTIWLVIAIALGASVGEFALLALRASGAQTDASSMARQIAHWSGVGVGVAVIFYLWHRSRLTRAAAQAAEVRQLQTQRQIAQSRLQILRTQIEPHFLFNTLATVRRLHKTGPARGSRLLSNFLEYLRSSLPSEREHVATLGDEINLVHAYLSVLEVRMTGRLQIQLDVPEELRGCEFPPLTLATLVENAIKHGIEPSATGGTVHVQARCVGPMLEVRVADTGVGFSNAGTGGAGIGLANIRARLATIYGAHGRVSLMANDPRGVCSVISLPRVAAQAAA